MATTPEILKTPKLYWITRRVDGHANWSFAFWRELFQNEVDAGAKRIDITVEDAPGKGAFGRQPSMENVVRVTFAGDGSGMDERVLREVFLRPGETTKRDGEYQGGFGTARIMLCFSQVRYSVRTHEWVVEGDGSEYTCQTVAQARESIRAWLDAARARGDEAQVRQLESDLAALTAGPAYFKGCRFEIDIDPAEFPQRWRNVDRAKLLTQLRDYLSMSQVPCRVFVDGVEMTERALKGPARRSLVTRDQNGDSVVFATVHTSRGERARYRGKLVVRSGGAAMFIDQVGVSEQVIVELDPKLSRSVLTDNRDSLKDPYRSVLQSFLTELAVDKTSAMQDKEKRKHIEIKGGKGVIVVRPMAVNLGDSGTIVTTQSAAAKPAKALYASREEYEVSGFGGASREVVDRFIDAVARGEETFLPRLVEATGKQEEAAQFLTAVRAGAGADALRHLGPELSTGISETLLARFLETEDSERAAALRRLADLNDVHIQIDDIGDDERLKAAVARYNPGYWRRKGETPEGRGMQAHMLLAAWTACCQEAIDTMLALSPNLARDGKVEFTTGFYFGKGRETWSRAKNGADVIRTGAQHQERDGTHILLVNPVTDDGLQAYDLTKDRRNPFDPADTKLGMQDLELLAIHEVAHMLEPYHDEDFATLMTRVAAVFDRARAHQRMRAAIDAVMAAYGRGQARVQAMAAPAAEPAPPRRRGRPRKVRPAEVLMAHAAPITTMVVGIANAQENADTLEAKALNTLAAEVLSAAGDEVTEVDCDRLQSLETKLDTLAKEDWDAERAIDAMATIDLDALPLPAVADMADIADLPTGADAPTGAASAESPPAVAEATIDLDALPLPAVADMADIADLPAGADAPTGAASAESPPAVAEATIDLDALPLPAVADMADIADLPAGADAPTGMASAESPSAESPPAVAGAIIDLDALPLPAVADMADIMDIGDAPAVASAESPPAAVAIDPEAPVAAAPPGVTEPLAAGDIAINLDSMVLPDIEAIPLLGDPPPATDPAPPVRSGQPLSPAPLPDDTQALAAERLATERLAAERLAALSLFGGELARLEPAASPAPPVAPAVPLAAAPPAATPAPVVETRKSRAAALVGEEFDLDGFDAEAGFSP